MSGAIDRETPLAAITRAESIQSLMGELEAGLKVYWQTADRILRPCGISLMAPAEEFFSLKRNFFSLLFLYSYYQAGIAPQRRILYSSTLHCLRGMVTGCDNLLDDEYKPTLHTDLPVDGHRFRSVVDIMVSDRALFQILMDAAMRREISMEQVREASAASMKTMARSGAEEASEEAGITELLRPEIVLDTVHHFKTGILFQCPWDIPLTIEKEAVTASAPMLKALYRIGLGCQIMDDMVDMPADIVRRRHNYLVSLVYHDGSPSERRGLEQMKSENPRPDRYDPADHFPEALHHAWQRARDLLTEGLGALLTSEDRPLVDPAIRFLQQRIGIHHMIDEADA